MVKLDDGRDFAVADLPGLIEGAADGVGLGLKFLRHVERTRVILHLIDMSGMEERDPMDDFHKINAELSKYDEGLLDRPQIVVATKMDLPDSAENLEKFKVELAKDDTLPQKPEVFAISSVTHSGLTQLISQTADLLDKTPQFPIKGLDDLETDYDVTTEVGPDFEIEQDEDGTWILTGHRIEKLFQMTDLSHDASLNRFARQMRGMGIDDALREKGAKNGDSVQIDTFTFEYVE